MIENQGKKEILRILSDLSARVNPTTVWADMCAAFSCSIANTTTPQGSALWERREAEYSEALKRYTDAERDKFPEVFANMVRMFAQCGFGDHLGEIYMEFIGGNTQAAQFFTPYYLSQLCARLADSEGINATGGKLSINDSSCGSGGMLIAKLEHLDGLGVNWQSGVTVYAEDIDRTCCQMAYIQLTLLGARAIVRQTDTLTQEFFDEWRTPFEVLKLQTSPRNKKKKAVA